MKKAYLIVTQTRNGVPVEAVCSNCTDITFHLDFTHVSLAEHLSAFKAMFDRHFQAVHTKV